RGLTAAASLKLLDQRHWGPGHWCPPSIEIDMLVEHVNGDFLPGAVDLAHAEDQQEPPRFLSDHVDSLADLGARQHRPERARCCEVIDRDMWSNEKAAPTYA